MKKPRTPKREVGPHPVTGQLVEQMSSTELRRQLVEDAIKGYATDLAWFTAAIVRIAERDSITVDDATREVWEEVTSLGGFMPGLA